MAAATLLPPTEVSVVWGSLSPQDARSGRGVAVGPGDPERLKATKAGPGRGKPPQKCGLPT